MNIIINTPDPNATINITINPAKTASARVESMGDTSGIRMLESLETKEDDELEMDYSDCKGFDESFMGFKTPVPDMEKQLQRKAAALTVDPKSFVLKYHHYSIIQHAVRKMPIVSAVNIDGNPAKRKDENKRTDKWMRDNRIDFDVQLTDAFYKNSGFDKGHMARREDANWGKTGDDAFISAQLTCMYTNACPQVPDLNRAIFGREGLWGQLEQIILENGVELESGKSTKICVYNGPIFVSTDPVFKGIQIPLRFFKVIVWINGAGEKKTTAFLLSQEDLVDDIQFEELQFDQEFKEHQCSITFLENLTGLRFTEIRQWDTFVDDTPAKKGVKRIRKNTLETMVAENRGKVNGVVTN